MGSVSIDENHAQSIVAGWGWCIQKWTKYTRVAKDPCVMKDIHFDSDIVSHPSEVCNGSERCDRRWLTHQRSDCCDTCRRLRSQQGCNCSRCSSSGGGTVLPCTRRIRNTSARPSIPRRPACPDTGLQGVHTSVGTSASTDMF